MKERGGELFVVNRRRAGNGNRMDRDVTGTFRQDQILQGYFTRHFWALLIYSFSKHRLYEDVYKMGPRLLESRLLAPSASSPNL